MLKSLLMKKERTGFPLIAAFGDRVTQGYADCRK